MATYRAYGIPAPCKPLELKVCDLSSLISGLSKEGVVVKIHAAGVCHTDLHLWHGYYQVGKTTDEVIRFSDRGMSYPKVPGHEIAGSVYAIGEHVLDHRSDLKLGERVLIYSWIGCDECNFCKAGDTNLCSNSRELGFVKDGGYSEFVAVPHYRYVFKTPDSIPDPLATMLPCSGITAFSAIKKTLPTVKRVRKWGVEVTVMVLGLGGLGQWSLNLLKYCLDPEDVQYVKIIGVDISKEKIDLALQNQQINEGFQINTQLGASQEVDRFLTQFSGNKVHIVFNFVGTTASFDFSISVLHRVGMLVMVGLHGGVGELKLPVTVLNMHTICGSYTGSLSDLDELISLVSKHSIPGPPLVMYDLEDANKALSDLEKGLVLGRAILKCDGLNNSKH